MSLFRAQLWDARSPIIQGTHNIIPDLGAAEPALPEGLTLDDFPEVLHAWEPSGLLGHGYALEDYVDTWTATVGPDDAVNTLGDPRRPRFLPGAYTVNGLPAVNTYYRINDNVGLYVELTDHVTEPYRVVVVTTCPFAGQAGPDIQRGIAATNSAIILQDVVQDLGTGGPYIGLQNDTHDAGQDLTPRRANVLAGIMASGANDNTAIDDVLGTPGNTGTSGDMEDLYFGSHPTAGSQRATWDYVQAVYVWTGSDEARYAEFVNDYLIPKYRTTHSPGAFPTFGAGDYFELDAEDITEGDGVDITSNWVDRQNGYAFVPGNGPIAETTTGKEGGRAVFFDGSTPNPHFDNNDITWSQPATFIVEAQPTPFHAGGNAGGGMIDGQGSTDRMVIWLTGDRASLYAGSTAQSTYWRGTDIGWRHFCGVFDGVSSLVGCDGQGLQTVNPGSNSLASGIRIGANDINNLGDFIGRISWIGGWNKALTQTQILDVFKYRGMV